MQKIAIAVHVSRHRLPIRRNCRICGAMIFASAYRQLQPSERAFVDEYVCALELVAVRSQTRLADVLRGPVLDTSERASGFLARPLVTAAISERVRELTDQMELSAHRVLKELAAIAFSSVGNYMTIGEDGQPYFDLARCTPEQLSAISSIEIEDNPRGSRKFKFKLHDKIQGLNMFMRYMGMLEADNPYWQEEQKRVRPVDQVRTLPAGANDDEAAAAYARLTSGG